MNIYTTSFYFSDFKGNIHHASTRGEAEQLRDKVGGGYVINQADRYETGSISDANSSKELLDYSFSSISYNALFKKESTYNKANFYLLEYGKVGLTLKTSPDTACLLYMLLMQEPVETLDNAQISNIGSDLSIVATDGSAKLITGSVSAHVGELIWRFFERLNVECSYKDPWDVQIRMPFACWSLWESGIDPGQYEAESYETRLKEAYDMIDPDPSNDEVPIESKDDLERLKECGLLEEEWSTYAHIAARDEEQILAWLIEQYAERELEQHVPHQTDFTEESYCAVLEDDDLERHSRENVFTLPPGYDGLEEEYWDAIGENADPGNHWD
jgi:hypothetical protein